jgi:hypothetical protein
MAYFQYNVMTTGWIYESDLWSTTASAGSSLTNLIKTEMNFQSGTTESCYTSTSTSNPKVSIKLAAAI